MYYIVLLDISIFACLSYSAAAGQPKLASHTAGRQNYQHKSVRPYYPYYHAALAQSLVIIHLMLCLVRRQIDGGFATCWLAYCNSWLYQMSGRVQFCHVPHNNQTAYYLPTHKSYQNQKYSIITHQLKCLHSVPSCCCVLM